MCMLSSKFDVESARARRWSIRDRETYHLRAKSQVSARDPVKCLLVLLRVRHQGCLVTQALSRDTRKHIDSDASQRDDHMTKLIGYLPRLPEIDSVVAFL